MADRIVDERTGKLCDYAALWDEIEALAARKRIPLKTAAGKIARSACLHRYEGILRNLRRERERRAAPSQAPLPVPSPVLLVPGLAVVYRLISDHITTLRTEMKGAPKGETYFSEAERAAEVLRDFIGDRLNRLSAMDPDKRKALAVALLGSLETVDLALSADSVCEAEIRELENLQSRIRSLLLEMDVARPKQKFLDR